MNKQTRTNVEAIIHRAVQENRRSLDFISLENLDTPWSDLADFRWTLDQIVKAIPDVESLDFSSTPVSDAELLALADKAQQLHHLKSLDFSITGVSDVGLQALAAQAEHLAALQSLNFEHTQVSDAGLIALAEQAQHLPALQSLRFGRTQVGDAGLFVLAEQVKHLHALQLLDFMGTRVSDAGLIALAAQAEHLTKLQALNFMGTQVGNEGLIALAQQAAHLHALQVLNLSWTQVSDEGLIALAQQATHLRALQSLVFWNTEVSDDGLFALAQQAAYLPQLRFLGVLETQVTVPSEILTSCDLARIYEFIVGRERLLPEVKLLLVGQGEAGKTHLRKRLFVEPAETMYHKADEKRTHDIEMTVWSMKVELKQKSGDGKQESKETKVLCRVWDFGGQDELHGSHRFFVGAVRCLYLLVLNATQDAKQNRLDYWLRLLAHHGRKQMGPGEPKRAPVMIVLTQCDTPCDRWGLPGTADNRFVDLINALTVAQRENWYGANVVACIGGFGWSDAVERLTQTQQLEIKQRHTAAAQRIVEELQRHIPDVLGLNSLFPLGFFTMKKWIEDLFTHDPAAPVPDAKYFKWHTNVAFRAMCEEAKISEGLRESYLAICRSLGLVHWVGDIPEIKRGNDADMKEFVFNPEWVKGPVYRLIRSLVAAENRGWMSNERLRARLPAPRKGVKNAPHLYRRLPFDERDFGNIQKLMLACRVAFQVTERPNLADGLLIPDVLKSRNRRTKWTNEDGNEVLHVPHHLDFLPERVFLRFIADHYQWIKDPHEDCWRDEVIVEYRDRSNNPQCEVLVQSELCPPPGEKPYLDISIRGGDPPARTRIAHDVLKEFEVIFQQEELARGLIRRDEPPQRRWLEEDRAFASVQPRLSSAKSAAVDSEGDVVTVDDGVIHCGAKSLARKTGELTNSQWRLFEALWAKKGKPVVMEDLFTATTSNEFNDEESEKRVLYTHVKNLKRKLKSLSPQIELKSLGSGNGYVLNVPE